MKTCGSVLPYFELPHGGFSTGILLFLFAELAESDHWPFVDERNARGGWHFFFFESDFAFLDGPTSSKKIILIMLPVCEDSLQIT